MPNSYILTGLPPSDNITAQMEREEFAGQLGRILGIRGLNAEDWSDLFWQLDNAIANNPVLLVLDEINWMGSKDPTFLAKLKTAWDTLFKKNPKLILILSGSMSAWIDRNILSSTGFLGRISLELTL